MSGLSDFEGVSSTISFQESGDAVRDFFVIRGLDGSWEVLETVDAQQQ